ncbi:HAD family hydrolase [Salinifilum aidingensis]
MRAAPIPARPTVGFDLDMTLIDPRRGIRRAYDRVGEERGVPLDGRYFADNLGPPSERMLRDHGVDEALVDDLARHYREIYPETVVAVTDPMPGAAAAVAQVRALGGRVLVVTGKWTSNAQRHLDHLGWEVDRLAGDVFAAAKGEVLRAEGAAVYVGDHPGDVEGARAAGALAVAVATGPHSAAELAERGADVVFDDLAAFAPWLASVAGQAGGVAAGEEVRGG